MTLTPEDIERQVFKQEFRGYNQEQVDAFLDRVTDRLIELSRERDLLASRLREAERHANERVARVEAYAEERVAEIERRAADAIESERLLKRALVTAERAADETVAQAAARADETVAHAHAKAAQTLTDARREAEQILDDARHQSATLLTETRERTRQAQETFRVEYERIQRTVADFTRFREEYRERVRSLVTEQLALLDEAGELPEVPPQLIDLSRIPEPNWAELPEWNNTASEGPEAFLGVDSQNGEPE